MTSPDPNAIPTFAFVVASLNDDGKIKITRSFPKQEPLAVTATANGIPYTEVVTQNFTVQVPYTEQVGDKRITRMRTETRTRKVPITRIRKRTPEEQKEFDEKMAKGNPGDVKPVVKQVSIPYVVQVPVTVEVDGKPVTTLRSEKRMRTVQVTRGKAKTTAQVVSDTYTMAELKCFGVDGSPLDEAEVKKRLEEKAAVILIKDSKAITPYFESLLKPGTMFMIPRG